MNRISINQVKKRWFRHWYVLDDTKGYAISVWTFKFGSINPQEYKDDSFYGPFWTKKAAQQFAREKYAHWHWAMFR